MDKKKRQETLNEVHVLKELKNPFIVAYKESFLDKKLAFFPSNSIKTSKGVYAL